MDAQECWDDLHKRKDFAPRYPEPIVVRWTFKNFPRHDAQNYTLLDLGCGHGRHAAFFAQNEYRAVASDFSGAAVEAAALRGNGYVLARCATDNTNFPDGHFDGVLCWHVLYYTDMIEESIAEIHRVLKPNGKALVALRSTHDSRYYHGDRLSYDGEGFGAIVSQGTQDVFADEAGLSMRFFTAAECGLLFRDFSQVIVEHTMRTEQRGLISHDDLLVMVTK